jgi:hypothetical protein
MSFELGVSLPQATPYRVATDVPLFAAEAERIGLDSLWALERLYAPTDQSGEHGSSRPRRSSACSGRCGTRPGRPSPAWCS